MVVSWLNVAVTLFLWIGIFAAGGTALWWFLRADGGVFLAVASYGFLTSWLWVGAVVETEPALAALLPHTSIIHLLAACVMAGALAGYGGQWGEGGALGFAGLAAVVVVCLHLYIFPEIAGWVYTSLLVVV
jgi:hypothetical protein